MIFQNGDNKIKTFIYICMCFMKVTEQISLSFQALFIYLQIY